MTPEQALADAKALQLETARELTLFYIPKEYKSLKNAKLASFNLLKTSYGTSIAVVNQIVLQTSNGKSQVALSNTLDQLIRNISRLTNGVNSIQINTKDFSTESLDTQSGPINMIKLLDDFENSRSKLSSLIPVLSKIKIGNNNLLGNLEVIFEANIVAIAAGLSLVSYPEVKAIAKSQGLAPIDNIDLGEVDATNSFIDQSINTIEKTANDIQTHFDQMHFTDKKTADSFKSLSSVELKKLGFLRDIADWLFGKDKKDGKTNWVDEYEARDPETTITYYQEVYGLTREQAEFQFNVYDKQFAEYADKQGWSKEEGSYQYFMMLASIAYQGFMWEQTAGVLLTDRDANGNVSKDSEWYKRMKAMGMADDDIVKMSRMQTGPYQKQSTNDENGDGVVNGADIIWINDNPNNDFLHMSAVAATQLNPNLKLLSEFGTVEEANEYASYLGDTASGSFGFADVRANMDGSNIAERIQKNDLDPFEALDGYGDDVSHVKINPAREFINNQPYPFITNEGKAGDIPEDSEAMFEIKKKIFYSKVLDPANELNPASIIIGRSGDKTPQEYVDYFDIILNGELEAPQDEF